MIGDVELFAQALAGQRSRVIAITGSNGKTTVTSLVGHLCQQAGLNTVVAGNIGLPVLDALCDIEDSGIWPDVFVLELSSFQLEGVRSPACRRRHRAEYLGRSPRPLSGFTGLRPQQNCHFCWRWRAGNQSGRCVLPRHGSSWPGRAPLQPDPAGAVWPVPRRARPLPWRWTASRCWTLPTCSSPACTTAANALAALALCEAIGLDRASLLAGLCCFKGLAHRVEHVLQLNGVDFYDDSKGTNVGATEAALNGMSRPVVADCRWRWQGPGLSPRWRRRWRALPARCC